MAKSIDANVIDTMKAIQNSNNRLQEISANKANTFTWRTMKEAERYNSSEAEKQRQFQLEQRSNAHQVEVQDLIRAGLNPVLSANNGASVTSGASGSVSGSSGQKADVDTQLSGLYAQLYMNKLNNAQQMKIAKMNNANALKMANISAAASMYGANASASAARFGALQAAAASMYGADQGYNASIYGYDKNSETSKWNTERNSQYKEWETRFNKYYGNDPSSLVYRVEHDAKYNKNKSSGRGKPAYYYD